MHVCVALGLNRAERDELFKIAFPEEQVWDEISELGLDIEAANELLVERGFKPFTEPE